MSGPTLPPTPIPRDRGERKRLMDEAMLTDEERAAIDQWCYDQQRERAQGVVSADESGRR